MTKWWGEKEFAVNEIKAWRIDSRRIIVQRKANEWLVWNDETQNESDNDLLIDTISDSEDLSCIPQNRYLISQTNPILHVFPALANRSVIVRPGSPLSVLPLEKAELYVSTPLWIKCHEPGKQKAMFDLPFWLPSDSWFGANTMEGELCYAKYTDAKMSLESIQKRSHRALTKICISNEHDEPLIIQRINVPTPFLDLYTDDENQIWTDTVNLIHNESNNLPSLDISKLDLVSGANVYSKICSGREIPDSKTFMRSIQSLIA